MAELCPMPCFVHGLFGCVIVALFVRCPYHVTIILLYEQLVLHEAPTNIKLISKGKNFHFCED